MQELKMWQNASKAKLLRGAFLHTSASEILSETIRNL
jgi:hypothetical protein